MPLGSTSDYLIVASHNHGLALSMPNYNRMKKFDPLPSLICSFVSSSATPPHRIHCEASSFFIRPGGCARVPPQRSRHKSTLVLPASTSTQLCPLVCCQHMSSFPLFIQHSPLSSNPPAALSSLLSLLSSFCVSPA
ncbi:hypothetical protein ACQKWADRAFT_300908 [Trichoderma austrokoningii]